MLSAFVGTTYHCVSFYFSDLQISLQHCWFHYWPICGYPLAGYSRAHLSVGICIGVFSF